MQPLSLPNQLLRLNAAPAWWQVLLTDGWCGACSTLSTFFTVAILALLLINRSPHLLVAFASIVTLPLLVFWTIVAVRLPRQLNIWQSGAIAPGVVRSLTQGSRSYVATYVVGYRWEGEELDSTVRVFSPLGGSRLHDSVTLLVDRLHPERVVIVDALYKLEKRVDRVGTEATK